MAAFTMKSKSLHFTVRSRTTLALRDDVMGGGGIIPSKETVAGHYFYGGRMTPFLTLTTPKGQLELTPAEVAGLRDLLDMYDKGTAKSFGRGFDAEARLLTSRLSDLQLAHQKVAPAPAPADLAPVTLTPARSSEPSASCCVSGRTASGGGGAGRAEEE